MSSGVIQPPPQPRQASNPALDPIGTSEGPLTLRAPSVGSYEVKGGSTKLTIEHRISEKPADIRDAARALSHELKSQTNELRQVRWNDPDRIAQRDNLVVLLENMAIGLEYLADNLDQAISKGTRGKPEPAFLGKAADVVRVGFTTA